MERNRYTKLKTKIALRKCDIVFLKRCLKNGIVPKFVEKNIKSRLWGKNSQKVITEARKKFIRLEIKSHYARIEIMKCEVYSLGLWLMKNLHPIIWQQLSESVWLLVGEETREKRQRLKKKFDCLVRESCHHQPRDMREEFIVNKSSHQLDQKEKDLLKKGLKYQPRPSKPPINDIIAAVETSIKYLPIETKAKVRSEVSTIMTKKLGKQTYQTGEYKIIKNLKESGIVFLAPDKGKGMVLMDKTDYEYAAINHLVEGPYKIVKSRRKFPVDAIQMEVKKGLRDLKRKGLITDGMMKSLVVNNPVVPSFSCLPKIHKEGNKFRPVVSDINSPTSKISQWIVRRCRSFSAHASLSVKNSIEAANRLNGMTIKDDEILISFDVESLYPSVPTCESLAIFKGWVSEQDITDDDAELVVGLMEIVLKQRWLEFNGMIYEQISGLAIGEPQSSRLAELFMGDFETAIKNESWFPKLWIRYVDDVIAIVKRDEAELVLNELNKRHAAIRFTSELENNGSLAFLDTRVIRENQKISIDIFRKPCDHPICIPHDSHHDINHKMAVFESLSHRMWSLPLSDERKKKEIEYLIEFGAINGYDRRDIISVNKKHENKAKLRDFTTLRRDRYDKKKMVKDHAGREVTRNAILPFYADITNPIKSVLRKNNINVCYTNMGTLKNILGCVKRKKPAEERSGIYRIPCEDCDLEYIGQTKRRLETREKEHSRALNNKQINISSVAKHCIENGHEKGKIQLVKCVKKPIDLDSYESLFIANTKNLMNEGEAPMTSNLFRFADFQK